MQNKEIDISDTIFCTEISKDVNIGITVFMKAYPNKSGYAKIKQLKSCSHAIECGVEKSTFQSQSWDWDLCSIKHTLNSPG